MGNSLYWRLPPKEVKNHCIAVDGLKYLLGKKLWDVSGSGYCEPKEVGKELLPYLQGIHDSASEDISRQAQALIYAIEKYGTVEIFIGQ